MTQDSPDNNSPLSPPVASTPALPATPSPVPPADQAAAPPSASDDAPQPPRSPRGKIARLPKITRDKLNFMLRDGLAYDDALARLGDEAKGISARNVSTWHNSPAFQHWLLEQDWLDQLRLKQESAFDILTDFDAPRFNEAALQLAVTRLFFALRHLEDAPINDKLGGNARTFSALVHALARACRETTNLEKYRHAAAQALAAGLKELDPDRDLSDQDYALLVKRMDRVFKVARRPAPNPPPPNNSANHATT